MELETQLADFADRIQSACGPYINFDEVQQWPKGRLDELLGMGVIIPTTHATKIKCTECSNMDCPPIEPSIETLPGATEPVGLFMCTKEGGGGFIKIPLERFKRWEIVADKLKELGCMDVEGEEKTGKSNGNKRKTKFEKIAIISKYLQVKPTATSKEVGEAVGIDPSDVRRLWGPIKKAVKEGKSTLPPGYKNDGIIDAIDESASCSICQDPLNTSFECEICDDIIKGECKTCHFTQSHPNQAMP